MSYLSPSELILNPDGSIYHLNLRPEEVATTIITVGDPERVAAVSAHFDVVEVRKAHREFVTHTGTLRGHRLTVISTGIGTDNIDIVLNELDALHNIDFATRRVKEVHTPLRIVRIGTSGSIRSDVPLGTYLVSTYALGLDGLGYFYAGTAAQEVAALDAAVESAIGDVPRYTTAGSEELRQAFAGDAAFVAGITLTCSGFYAPQVRALRLSPRLPQLFEQLDGVRHDGLPITNMEMETAGIYLLARLLGHEALSVSVLLANRRNGAFAERPSELVADLIVAVLDKLTAA